MMARIISSLLFAISFLTGQWGVDESRHTAITRAIESVEPAVASISVVQLRDVYNSFSRGRDPFFDFFFPERSRKKEVRSSGSGVVISPDGYVMTNFHVIENATEVMVTLPGGEEYEAEIIGTDFITDLALLKLRGRNFPYATLGDSDDLIIGEWAIALGNPFGLFDISKQPTATAGIISAMDMDFGFQSGKIYKDMIQTDAAINRGNSGGPLVNSLGEVIGINTFIYTASQFAEGSIGIGFAIPINLAKDIAEELKVSGKVDRSFSTGLSVERLTEEVAEYLDVPLRQGVIVVEVEKSSNAQKAGVKVGDIITDVNGQKIRSSREILKIIKESDLRSGNKIKLKIYRDGKTLTKYLILASVK
ncbi:MAG: trypsin-like peptidase domain-containing protein [Candidatus Marinimicrobia bacterium]|jgi:serine protease Do|nr:trypsin-like peptidase domain-containing protein [Candidatus Neomarinimicrobiota bacterium]MDP6229836.1 trypsin-like peptidase domain-containing protein [Candidatus Neomarinimicrobiota bacterium]MDP7094989.1 trypsin-like peptidase domain-containing protein [Candidatus Neomarinimicrobiota bacterium]MDP7512608.1 trypsin-like peptidase domain-containing protein [Candidatus Neomarinimicrobiota bacterium]HJL63603.1 trypsin-like peptidase domain-containing protein [Candidatus Neomarinimicrobiota b